MTKIAFAPPGHAPVLPFYMVAHCAAGRENQNIDAHDKEYRSCDDGGWYLPMPDNADPKRPTIDERLEAIKQTLELTAATHLDNDREFRERFAEIARRQAQDGEHIRALARIAEIHERRPSHLEGEDQ
jgi:hypothetical protein